MKEWFTSFFYFSKKERLGAYVMLALISSIWLLPIFFRNNIPDQHIVALVDNDKVHLQGDVLMHNDSAQTIQLFYFDPNTISDSGWVALGLSGKVIKTIKNYLSKGGKFKSPDDLKRIYGLSIKNAERLIPFVRITFDRKQYEKLQWQHKSQKNSREVNGWKFKSKGLVKRNENFIQQLNLNLADTGALIDLPGIGSKLAKRIVDFRNHAGGFHALEQLSEIYGLQDSTFLKLKKYIYVDGKVRKIRINVISEDSLVIHPYINKSQAKALIRFRQMHGPFENIEAVKMIHNLDLVTINKLQPYLEF